jgi:hypothetical protein
MQYYRLPHLQGLHCSQSVSVHSLCIMLPSIT